ncbi:MAG: alpha-amylase family glycosyl hydrolase [Anaerolineaceae bacterium]|nr:alpha-amylase family glycosyl hydrolase [Anaerolineaceae bacterium]
MVYPEWLNSLYHSSTADYLSDCNPKLGDIIGVRLGASIDAPIEQIVLRTLPDGEQQFSNMTKVESVGHIQYWQADMTINQPLISYRFGIQSADGVWWRNAAGISIQEPFSLFDFKIIADLAPISWLNDAVFYQIFPDRFENGNPGNDPKGEPTGYPGYTRETLPWGQAKLGGGFDVFNFYGGDLEGISKRLDYLTRLGVNAIYLNPIFSALSNHRYDGVDYEKVDPALGGDEALIGLRKQLAKRGMHYLLDIVPNHCGYFHPWFQKAREDAQSEEASYFFFDQHPDGYESWMGHRGVPKLNYASNKLREKMYAGSDSIIRRWLKPPFSADGWRVDVANMLAKRNDQQWDQQVIAGIRQAVKSTNPDSYLIGENFYESSSQLQGEGWDAVMNYAGFSAPLWSWLAGYKQDALNWQGKLVDHNPWPTEALVKTWVDHLATIPWQIALQQFNVLGSHDTTRIRSLLKGNDSLHRLAVMVQFTFPGVPCVYYGDEIGLMDEDGFGSRNCMVWSEDKWDQSLFEFYQAIITFRKSSDILKEGSFQVLHWEKDFILYQRVLGQKRILVTANRSPEMRPESVLSVSHFGIWDGLKMVSLFDNGSITGTEGSLKLPELPQGGEIWVERM